MGKARKKQQQTAVTEPVPRCAAQHFGYWAVKTDWLTEAVAAYGAGTLKPREASQPQAVPGGRLAVIALEGELVKGDSSFGGTSTIRARQAVRAAAADSSVKGIMLHIDSPGGTVAGAYELADDIAEARGSKPVYAHIADLGASAAYLMASQADRITANRTALVGSLGTFATLVDESGALDRMGIKVHVVSSGGAKGEGYDGKVTEGMLSDAQQRIDDLNQHFIAAVRDGRGFGEEEAAALFDGRVHVAQKAKGLGLIDEVSSFDEAMTQLSTEIQNMDSKEFAAYAAEHPEELAVAASEVTKTAHARGHTEGVSEERDRCKRIAAMSGDPSVLRKHIDAGSSVAAVRDDLFEAQQAEIKALRDQVAKVQQPTGHAGVAVAVPAAEPSAKPDGSDPKALAEWEFDNNQTTYKSSNRSAYVNYRVAEMAGRFRAGKAA